MKRWILILILLGLVLFCSLTITYGVKQDGPKPALTFEEYSKKVGDKSKTVLVYFHADWCIVCKRMQPVIDKVSKEYTVQMEILSLDAERDKEVSDHFEINSLPVMIFYKNGSLKWSHTGVITESELKKKLSYYVETP